MKTALRIATIPFQLVAGLLVLVGALIVFCVAPDNTPKQ